MLVRHPMERLVSCYFDKMVNGTHKSLRGFRKFVKNKAQSRQNSVQTRKKNPVHQTRYFKLENVQKSGADR